MEATWKKHLQEEMQKDYFIELMNRVNEAYREHTVYPRFEDIFKALELTPLNHVKVVILGQDPYHQEGQAHGLSFSVQKGVKFPPSLRNIFKEAIEDVEIPMPTHGNLSCWAKQGVLLLNTTLSVQHGKAASHAKWGWQKFTDAIIKQVNQLPHPVVFILWGNYARSKKSLIADRHFIIESAHPSPLSSYQGFFGSKPFSSCNKYLSESGQTIIDWQVEE